ncbi:hypothetical protein AB0B57_32635, partial [Micromonospora sp. NPDC049101]|uniref:hypothetical protein n=1 Tax=Micromonospora sp. NPDC049101 TaxID=3155032 RepID=UPI0033DB61C9
MAFRTWGRLLLTALGVSVLAGAGQLGVAYGFGIVRLTGAFTGTTVNQWPAQLVWVGWFAANAAVVGAVLTGRLARSDAPAASTRRQLAIGGAAALGAVVIAPLCMQPARAAELISVDPVWAVGICAVLGAVIGAGAAIAVQLRPELGWNMAAVAGAVWLLALISVLPSLGTAGPLPTVRLGVLEPSWLDDAAAQRLALLLLPIVALLAGAATAGLARWRGQEPLISGATGVAGPVLVAFAYLTAGPGDSVDRYQVNPYYGALIAILAGALGAAAAALLRWPSRARTAGSAAIEPTDILGALPTGPALPNAASASPANDEATANRTDAPEPAGSPTVAPPAVGSPAVGSPAVGSPPGELAGSAPGPRAAGGSDGVRTVPAHWDWPATTASGQHGSTPAVPAKPASWLTDPTGEFTARRQMPSLSRDDVISPAETTRPAKPADTSPTGTTAGRADAADPTAGPAADEPTGSIAASTSATPTGGRTTAPTGAASTGSETPGAGTVSTGTSSTAAAGAGAISSEPVGATAASTGTTGADEVSTGTTGTTATSTETSGTTAASTETSGATAASSGTSGAAKVSTDPTGAVAFSTGTAGTDEVSTGTAGAVAASTGAASADEVSAGRANMDGGSAHGTSTDGVDAPLTVKPRRVRKPKASPLATTNPADGAPASGSTGTDETAAGTDVPDEEGQGSESGPVTEATPTAASAAAPTTRTGRTRTPVTPTPTTGPTRTPTPTSTAGPTRTPTPTTTAGPTRTPTPTTTAGPTRTPTPTTTAGPTRTPTPTT